MSNRNYELFDFAFFPNYEGSIKYLAENLADKEEWNFLGSKPKKFPILKSYLEHTYRKLKEEKKISYTEDNKHACFNTGLVTSNFEDIFAYFEEYEKREDSQAKNHKNHKFCFKAFLKESDNQLEYFIKLPETADFF